MAVFASGISGYVQQDVGALLDYSEDWAPFLVGDDELASSEWAASPAGLLLSDPYIAGKVATVWISGGVAGAVYRVSNTITTTGGRRDVRYFTLSVVDGGSIEVDPLSSALFNRFTAVAQFKTESLAFVDGSFPVGGLTDDYIWSSLVAAEADVAHSLRVFLAPTVVIPSDAPQSEVDALKASGTRFVTEAAYDYEPSTWTADNWGFILLRKTPAIRVDSVIFSYPSAASSILTIPPEWIRVDPAYGHVRFVPSGPMMNFGPMTSLMMTAISSGRRIPAAIRIRYVAGLENAARDYPELVSLVKRMAILRILKSAFLPQSGSISGDGLSQSSSIDTDKWQSAIENDLASLRDTIHGIRFGVL